MWRNFQAIQWKGPFYTSEVKDGVSLKPATIEWIASNNLTNRNMELKQTKTISWNNCGLHNICGSEIVCILMFCTYLDICIYSIQIHTLIFTWLTVNYFPNYHAGWHDPNRMRPAWMKPYEHMVNARESINKLLWEMKIASGESPNFPQECVHNTFWGLPRYGLVL